MAAVYPEATPELARKRRELAPEVQAAFESFGRQVFSDGALPSKTKQLIAVAVAHVTQCPYCIQGHTRAAQRARMRRRRLVRRLPVRRRVRARRRVLGR